MSMVLCHYCESLIDSDEFPDGFYVLGHKDKYICDSCQQDRDLYTEFNAPEAA